MTQTIAAMSTDYDAPPLGGRLSQGNLAWRIEDYARGLKHRCKVVITCFDPFKVEVVALKESYELDFSVELFGLEPFEIQCPGLAHVYRGEWFDYTYALDDSPRSNGPKNVSIKRLVENLWAALPELIAQSRLKSP